MANALIGYQSLMFSILSFSVWFHQDGEQIAKTWLTDSWEEERKKILCFAQRRIQWLSGNRKREYGLVSNSWTMFKHRYVNKAWSFSALSRHYLRINRFQSPAVEPRFNNKSICIIRMFGCQTDSSLLRCQRAETNSAHNTWCH